MTRMRWITLVMASCCFSAWGFGQEVAALKTVDTLRSKAESGALASAEVEKLGQALLELVLHSDVGLGDMLRYIRPWVSQLPIEQKARIRNMLTAKLTEARETIASLRADQVLRAGVTLGNLQAPLEQAKLIAGWMDASDSWKTADHRWVLPIYWSLGALPPEAMAERTRALVDNVWRRYLGPKGDASELPWADYVELSLQFNRFFSPEQKRGLFRRMVKRLEPELLAQLSLKDFLRTCQTVGVLGTFLDTADVAAAWMQNSREWRKAGPGELARMVIMLRQKRDLYGTYLADLRDHVRARMLIANRSVTTREQALEWLSMVREFRWMLSPEERTRIAQLIVDTPALTDPQFWQTAALPELEALFATAREFNLNAQPIISSLSTAILSGEAWRKLRPDVLEMMEFVLKQHVVVRFDAPASEALVRLCCHVGHDAEASQWAWNAFTRAGAQGGPETLDQGTLTAIERTLDMAGLREGLLTAKWRWSLLLRQVAVAPQEERLALWKQVAPELLGKIPFVLTGKSLEDLDKLLDASGDDPELPPERLLVDLIAASGDGCFTEARLHNRLNAHRLRKQLKSAPKQLQEMIGKANTVRAKSPDEAIVLYSKAIQDHRDHAAVPLIRRALLPLLFERGAKVEVIESHLAALTPGDRHWPADMRDFAYRILFRKALAASARGRRAVWSEGLRRLSGGDGWLSDQTFAELDKFVEALGEESSLSPPGALTDLLLLTSDIPSVHKLQQRRIAAFAKAKSWDAARDAARLDVMFAIGTKEGPWRSAKRSAGVMKSAGAPSHMAKDFEEWSWGGAAPTAKGTGPITDRHLKKAAEMFSQNVGVEVSAGRQAFLLLFQGKVEGALAGLHRVLAESPANGRCLSAFDALSLAMAVAEGRYDNCERFVRWLAKGESGKITSGDRLLDSLIRCEGQSGKARGAPGGPNRTVKNTYWGLPAAGRRTLAQNALSQRQALWIAWGKEAFLTGDSGGAADLWGMAIDAAAEPKKAVRLIDMIYRRTAAEQSEQGAELFKTLVRRLHSPTSRRLALLKLAEMQYAKGGYGASLKSVDEAAGLVRTPEEAKNMSVGFIQAMSLIHLKQFKKALKSLNQMETWPGTPEEHARAVFLAGWVHLQQNNRAKAIAVFERLVDKYPNTTFRNKAERLAKQLKGA